MPSLTAESKPCNLLAPYYTHDLKREKKTVQLKTYMKLIEYTL
jgi:hypothetical protein